MYVNVDGQVDELGTVDPTFPENLLACVVTARLSGLTSEEVARSVAQVDRASGLS